MNNVLKTCTLGALSAIALTAKAEKKPNIIFIMADDLGYGDLSCYGSRKIKTPHLDELAATGIKFTDAHSNGAVCSPSRAAFFTGRYQQHYGITGVVTAAKHRHAGLSLDAWTIGEAMKEQGYRTALFGKWHLGYKTDFNPSKQGFDIYKGFVAGNVDYHNKIDLEGYYDWLHQDKTVKEEGYVTDLINNHAINFVEENRENPFFLVMTHGAPHAPYQGPNDKGFRKLGTSKHPKESSVGIDTGKAFLEMMTSMDTGIGRLVDKLDELGIRDNTLVIFTSDNGPAKKGSSGGLRGGKSSIYEGGHRVPTIANWPGVIKPQISDSLIMAADMLPTFVELAGGKITPEKQIDGKSIVSVLKGESMQRELLFWGYKSSVAVRDGNWKFIYSSKGKSELYDLSKDLKEKNNRAKAFPERVKTFIEAIKKWQRYTKAKKQS